MRPRDLARAIAWAAAAGEWGPEPITARIASALDAPEAAWMRALGRRLAETHSAPPLDLDVLAGEVARDRSFRKAIAKRAPLHVRRYLMPEPRMGPQPFEAAPPLATLGDVAAFLDLSSETLDWLADTRGMNRRAHDPQLHHYVYRWIPKRSGGLRLLEAPKPELKRAQRAVLHRILAALPSHPAAAGFVPGRSLLDHVRAHSGKRIVVRLDLESFFWSVPLGRIYGVFRFLGYPPEVVRALVGLATTRTPSAVLAVYPKPLSEREARERFELRRRLAHPHLPQGAPTSGALASACARSLDRRLHGLAARFGATYSRYADDLAFSGDRDLERGLGRFLAQAGAIAIEEGFAIRHAKTRVLRASVRQELCGVVVNAAPSMRRTELERLEAILVNCARRGPRDQDREGHPDFRAHLAGRIAWVAALAPHKAERLRAIFARIDWAST